MAQAVPTDPVSAIAVAVGQVAEASSHFGEKRRIKLQGKNVQSELEMQKKNILLEKLLPNQNSSSSSNKTLMYVGIGVGVLALVGIVYVYAKKK